MAPNAKQFARLAAASPLARGQPSTHLADVGGSMHPNAEERNEMVRAAMQFINKNMNDDPATVPLAGSGHRWMVADTKSAETKAAVEMYHDVLSQPFSAKGEPLSPLLDKVEELTKASMNEIHPGYMSYVASGGLFHSAVAGLIASSMNRFVTGFMGAPGLQAIEDQCIHWIATDVVGMPSATCGGVLTVGGSHANMYGIHAAREKYLEPKDLLKGVLYVSEQAHHSVKNAARFLGVLPENIREVSSDANYRIDTERLQEMIAKDKEAGLIPFLVAGCAGTTNTGSIDDLDAMANIAEENDIWFHVDGAYGGFFNLTKEGRVALKGVERADSMVLDPHKSLFMPYGLGALVVRDKQALKSANSTTGCYLHPQSDHLPTDIMDMSPELTRDFRGLRMWLPLKMLGVDAFVEQLEDKMSSTRWACRTLEQIPGLEIVCEPTLTTFAFKLNPVALDSDLLLTPKELDIVNQKLVNKINSYGNVLLSPFRAGELAHAENADGQFCCRIAILSHRTDMKQVKLGVQDICKAVIEVMRQLSQGQIEGVGVQQALILAARAQEAQRMVALAREQQWNSTPWMAASAAARGVHTDTHQPHRE
jgi:aromatic-L-amino-acid decarboxylase